MMSYPFELESIKEILFKRIGFRYEMESFIFTLLCKLRMSKKTKVCLLDNWRCFISLMSCIEFFKEYLVFKLKFLMITLFKNLAKWCDGDWNEVIRSRIDLSSLWSLMRLYKFSTLEFISINVNQGGSMSRYGRLRCFFFKLLRGFLLLLLML